MEVLRFTNKSMDNLCDELSRTKLYKGKVFRLVNLHNLSLISKSLKFRTTMQINSISIVDSFPLKIILSLKHRRRIHQIRGTDLLRSIMFSMPDNQTQLFVCPSPETAQIIAVKLQDYNLAARTQFLIPPFLSNEEDLVRYFDTNFPLKSFKFVWIGIGTPKQDYVASALSEKYPDTTFFCIGAALEFFTGLKKEAPKYMRVVGLEWFFRFLMEPRRLFNRYFFQSLPAVFYILLNRTNIL